MTTQTELPAPFPASTSHARAPARTGRNGRARRPRTPALCAAMLCAGSLWADAAQARTPRPPRAASTPTTAQILAPSAATVPDALPPARLIYRCGNSYSPHPCPDAKPVNVTDPRTDGQRLQAEDVAARDKRLASWLEAGRHERDRAASEPRNGLSRAAPGCVPSAAVVCEIKKPKVVRRTKPVTAAKGVSASGK